MNFEDAMRETFQKIRECEKAERAENIKGTPELLKGLYSQYAEGHEFKPGDVVRFKESLQASKYPLPGEAAIVLEVVPGRRPSAEQNHGSNHEDEPNGVRIGCMVKNSFEGFWEDENRLEPWPEA